MVQADDLIRLVVPPVCLTFRKEGPRWSHDVEVDGTPVASSVEWEPGRDDPARVVSPAYQQVLVQQTPEGGDQALLVGGWGAHHGAAVFTLTGAAAGVAIEVDVAVRTRADLQAMASTYTVHLSSGALVDAGPNAITWILDPPVGGRLRFESGSPFHVALAEAGRRRTRVQAGAEIVGDASTHRLLYRWQWLRPS